MIPDELLICCLGQARLIEDAVRVRKCPDMSGTILGYLHVGDVVDVWAKQGLWWVIQTASGLTGYSFGKFMEMVAEVWDGTNNADAGTAGRGA